MDDDTPSSLFTALLALCRQFETASGIECRASLEEAHLRFDGELGDAVYRAARELLTNVRLHARATRVEVAASAPRGNWVRLAVTDNGVGFAAPWRHSNPFTTDSGLGLWSIDQRLRHFDAYLEIDSTRRGTRATLVLPADRLGPS